MNLRSKPLDKLSEDDVKSMLQKHGFYDYYMNEGGKGIEHAYKKVVFDGSTGLYWQRSGSADYMNFENAQAYIAKLNDDKFAGYDNWRLPTLDEAMSLMEPEKQNGDLYIDPVFDARQDWIWTADKEAAGRVWYVDFLSGYCGYDCNVYYYGVHVRAVRS